MQLSTHATELKRFDTDFKIIADLRTSGIFKRKAEVQLFERFYYLVRTVENRYSLSREDLLDAYSDTVLSVLRSITIHDFQNRCSLKTFIYEVYQNKCIDRLRKRATLKNMVHKTEALGEMQTSLSDNSLSVIERMVNQSDMEWVQQQMTFLSDNSRNALLLSLKGYSDKEIAAMIKFKTADVAKTMRLRSIKKLRQMVS